MSESADSVEVYDDRLKAELLLNNAIDAEDYRRICDEVRRLGLDPALVPHEPPPADKGSQIRPERIR